MVVEKLVGASIIIISSCKILAKLLLIGTLLWKAGLYPLDIYVTFTFHRIIDHLVNCRFTTTLEIPSKLQMLYERCAEDI